jgi:hypothetical protein
MDLKGRRRRRKKKKEEEEEKLFAVYKKILECQKR